MMLKAMCADIETENSIRGEQTVREVEDGSRGPGERGESGGSVGAWSLESREGKPRVRTRRDGQLAYGAVEPQCWERIKPTLGCRRGQRPSQKGLRPSAVRINVA